MLHLHKLGLAAVFAALAATACTKTHETVALSNGTPAPAPVATPASPTGPVTVLPSPSLARAGAGGNVAIADVVARVLPSVVSVWSTRVTHAPAAMGFGPFGFPDGPRELRQQGLGSGVVVAPGIVVTNNHVVADADELKITTPDKHELEAKVVGTDPKTDIAVLRVSGDTSGLKPIELGDSSRLRLGDVVLAVGNPFGIGQTVTMGIVSAKGRANMGIEDYEDFIQTDAAINPGNSGGALVDMEGHLVGINTAILSRSGGSVGIGFAIPSNMARPIADSLLKNGRVVRGWLGVAIQDVDQDIAAAMKLASVSGVLVGDVTPNTPAARAGLQRGDVIAELDGKPIDSVAHFRNTIAADGAGAKVKLHVLRAAKALDVEATLGEMPNDGARVASAAHASPTSSLDGLTLSDATPELRKRYQVPNDVTGGVIVTAVEPGSAAARTGLRPGDVVLEIDRQRVTSVARFRALYARSQGQTLMLVSRGGATAFVVVRH